MLLRSRRADHAHHDAAYPAARGGQSRRSGDPLRQPHRRHHRQGDGLSMVDELSGIETGLFIGGAWRRASDGAEIAVFDPATEEKIASVASATIDDAIDAV